MLRFARCTVVLALLAACVISGSAQCTTWDAAAGFSGTQNPYGAWSYGSQYDMGLDFTLYTKPVTPAAGLSAWENDAQYWPGTVCKNTTGQPINYQVNWNGWLEANQIVVYPGLSDDMPTVRWTSPINGFVKIQAKFTGQTPNALCTTTDVHVLRNGTSLFDGNVSGFMGTVANNYADAIGSAPKVSYETIAQVSVGDTIDFVVGFGADGDFYDDCTGLAATITTVADQGATVTGKVTSTLPKMTTYSVADRGGVDSFVEESHPDANFGGNDKLYITNSGGDYVLGGAGWADCPVYQWDLDLADGESIQSVTSATVRIAAWSGVPTGTIIRFYRLTAPFDEYNVTWNNRPARDESTYVEWAYPEAWTLADIDISPLLRNNGTLHTFGIEASVIPPKAAGSWDGAYFSWSNNEADYWGAKTTRMTATYTAKHPTDLAPIVGATVNVAGTDIESTTDANGDYSLVVPSSSSWTAGGVPIAHSFTGRVGIDSAVNDQEPDSTAFSHTTTLYMTNSGGNYLYGAGWTICPVYQWNLDVPDGESMQSVTSAIMKMASWGGVPVGTKIRFHRLTAPFTEDTVCWNNRPARDESAYVDWTYQGNFQDNDIDLTPLLQRNGALKTFGVEASPMVPREDTWGGAYFCYTKEDADWGVRTTLLNAVYNTYDTSQSFPSASVDLIASAYGYETTTKPTYVVKDNTVTQNFILPAGFTVPATKPIAYSDNVTINGDLSEWSTDEFTPMDAVYNIYQSTEDRLLTDIPEAYYAARWGDNGHKLYVAVMVRDTSHHFTNSYTDWNVRDAAEIYVHTTGPGAVDYSAAQVDAQQYVVGITADNHSQVWSCLGANLAIPAEANFQAAGKEVGQWLYYEVAITPFEHFTLAGTSMVPNTLTPGQIVGVDVVADGAMDVNGAILGAYAGQKAANYANSKWRDYTMFAKHVLVQNGSVGSAINSGDGISTGLDGVVSAAFNGFFYVESLDRTSGIRVVRANHGVVTGQPVYIYGTTGSLPTTEKCIVAQGITPAAGSTKIDPLGMNNKAIGGGAHGQPGVSEASGLNNIGLLIRTTGKVVAGSVTADSFKIDDGSGVDLTIIGTLPTGVDYVTVTGVSSCVKSGSSVLRSIIATDIQ